MPTYEFYLEKHGSFGKALAIHGKPDADPIVRKSRKKVRKQLAKIARPIMQERMTPFVNEHFAAQCKGQCTPCYSFVRRYREHERRTHATHFDIQALVTVVVSLNSYGRDFDGGLHVSTGSGSNEAGDGPAEKQFLGLQAGDAVAHQSDLLHGVQVMIQEPAGASTTHCCTMVRQATGRGPAQPAAGESRSRSRPFSHCTAHAGP
jgi:hypothetical protein